MNATGTQPSNDTSAGPLGKPIDRADGRLKVTGGARYAVEFPVRNVAYAVAFQSTIAKGHVTAIDSTAAEKVPGVLKVMTHANAPVIEDVPMEHDPGRPGQTFIPLQDSSIRYAGQFLGVVIAETLEAATHAASLVKISYQPEKPTFYIQDAMPLAYKPEKIGRGDKPDTSRGDADAALASAAIKIDQVYYTPVENHNPMEMSATTAAWDGDHLMLHDATQWVLGVRSVVAGWLGLPEDNLRVIDPYVGGGFGCKGSTWPHVLLASLSARLVGRPVRFMLTRSQMFSCVGYRSPTIQRIALGADHQGKLLAAIHEVTSQTSSWRDEFPEAASKPTRMLYQCDNLRVTQRMTPLDVNTPTQMRAPGEASGSLALEVAMDELAYALKMDPLELRLRNYAEMDQDEKKPFSSKELRECYRQGAKRFGWPKRNPEPRSMRDGRTLIGWGMATAVYPTNRGEAQASIRLHPDGHVLVQTAAHDLGMGTYTILAQVAAEYLGMPVENVEVQLADTNLPQAPVAGGSQTAASAGSAVEAAALEARQLLMKIAVADKSSALHGMKVDDLIFDAGRVVSKSDPSRGQAVLDILARYGQPVAASAKASPKQKVNGKSPEDFSKYAFGADFAEVRIDPDLGEIRVSRFVGAFAAGKILNAKTARSQVMGGIVWGISMALFEQTIYDPRGGKIVNDNLADYLVPINADIPAIDCFFVKEDDPYVNPLGCKGIGEIGITGAGAAVANAVYHATGNRFRTFPITLDQLV